MCRGAEHIGDMLKMTKLESLLLHWNEIRGKGAMYIFKALRTQKSMKELDLSFNSIG